MKKQAENITKGGRIVTNTQLKSGRAFPPDRFSPTPDCQDLLKRKLNDSGHNFARRRVVSGDVNDDCVAGFQFAGNG